MAKRNRGFRRGPRGGYSPAERASLPSSAFLKPETRSWPVSDLQHAKIALQYMSRGFGNRSEYGMLLHRLFERYPPSQYPDLAEMYERLQDKIQAKAGGHMARTNTARLSKVDRRRKRIAPKVEAYARIARQGGLLNYIVRGRWEHTVKPTAASYAHREALRIFAENIVEPAFRMVDEYREYSNQQERYAMAVRVSEALYEKKGAGLTGLWKMWLRRLISVKKSDVNLVAPAGIPEREEVSAADISTAVAETVKYWTGPGSSYTIQLNKLDRHDGGRNTFTFDPPAVDNPQARENWVNFAIQAGLAILPSVVAGFKKLSAKKLAQYEKLVASNDIEGQLAFIRKHAWINPGLRAVLANDDAAEWLRVNLNEALAQGAGEAALAAAGTAADVGAAVATAKAGGASGDALKAVAAQTALQAATNPHRSPGLYMLYSIPRHGLQEFHEVVAERHKNMYGQTILKINWPETAKYVLGAFNSVRPSEPIFYGVRQDGKQIELSLSDMERLASMDVAGARKDIQSRNNPRTRKYTIFHIEPHGGYREGLEDAKDWGKRFVEEGLSSGFHVERSEDISGPYRKKTVKLKIYGIPITRVMNTGSNHQVIEQTIQKHIGTLLGSYTESRQESAGGPAVRPNGKSRKKKQGVSRRSVVHQQHIQKTPKAGPYGSKKGKKGYTRKRKHPVRENRSMRGFEHIAQQMAQPDVESVGLADGQALRAYAPDNADYATLMLLAHRNLQRPPYMVQNPDYLSGLAVGVGQPDAAFRGPAYVESTAIPF